MRRDVEKSATSLIGGVTSAFGKSGAGCVHSLAGVLLDLRERQCEQASTLLGKGESTAARHAMPPQRGPSLVSFIVRGWLAINIPNTLTARGSV